MHRLTVIIRGRVQGVWFRVYTKRKADALGLVGYAKNNSDGSVTVVAEGQESILRELLICCRIGPEIARVESLGEHWEKIKELRYSDFQTK